MVLHAFPRLVIPVRPLSRRGLSPPMYLHENRPTPVTCRAATARHTVINQGRTDHDHPHATAGL
ncbi:hypothetical protein CK504_020255 [Klebsiella pneumoniae]|nr:hypothetical protein CK504_020255 [Klebsiella pneumoniae]